MVYIDARQPKIAKITKVKNKSTLVNFLCMIFLKNLVLVAMSINISMTDNTLNMFKNGMKKVALLVL